MKKLLITGGILLATLAIGAITLPFLISSEAVRSNLLERAREITGREMQFTGDPRVSFSPFLGIEIQDVVFGKSGATPGSEPILTMPYLRAKLSFASALRGQIVIDEFQFFQPNFNLKLYASGNTSWAFSNGEVWRTLQEAKDVRANTPTGSQPDLEKLSDVRLGKFTVISGTVEYQNERYGRTETITNFNGTLVWPNIRSGWMFKGDGIWRGDGVTIATTAETPIMLLAGGSSKATAEIRSETANFSFNGEANRFSDLFISGKLETSASSLRKMIGIFGGNVGVGSNFSNFKASGNISGTFNDLQLESAVVELDGNKFTGGLRLSILQNKTNQLNGTLASPLVDLAPYFTGLEAGEGIGSAFDILHQTGIDLRMSAAKMKLAGVEISDFAGGLIVKDGVVKIDVGNSSIGEGIVVGSVETSKTDNTLSVAISADGGAINLASLNILNSESSIRPVGRSDVKLRLDMKGSNIDEMIDNLNGEFSLSMNQGQLIGLDFRGIRSSLAEDEKKQENIQIGNSALQTQVSEFELKAIINRGVGWVQGSRFKIEEYNAAMSGKADLRSGNLALWGMLSEENATNAPKNTQFFLGGTIGEPLFVPSINGVFVIPGVEDRINENNSAGKETNEPGKTN